MKKSVLWFVLGGFVSLVTGNVSPVHGANFGPLIPPSLDEMPIVEPCAKGAHDVDGRGFSNWGKIAIGTTFSDEWCNRASVVPMRYFQGPVEGGKDFSWVYNHCGGLLQPGQACWVELAYTPTVPGMSTATSTVSFVWYSSDGNPHEGSTSWTWTAEGYYVDFSVSDLVFPGRSRSGGPVQVVPGVPTTIYAVVGADFINERTEDRNVVVRLQYGTQHIDTSISALSLLNGAQMVPFQVTFDQADGNTQTVTAIVDPDDLLQDPNTENDEVSVDVQLGGPDLSVGVPQVSQKDAIVGSDGNLQVDPSAPVQIKVPVSGSGFASPETRSAVLKLETEGEVLETKVVSLAAIQAAGTLMVPFAIDEFDEDVLGTVQTITATIDPEDTLNDPNVLNDSASVDVDVVITLPVFKITQLTNCPWPEPNNSKWLNGVEGDDTTIWKRGCALTSLDMSMLFEGAGDPSNCKFNSFLTGSRAFAPNENGGPGIGLIFDAATSIYSNDQLLFLPVGGTSDTVLKHTLFQRFPAIVKVVSHHWEDDPPWNCQATTGVHFVVVIGINEEGEFLIRDPGTREADPESLSNYRPFGNGAPYCVRGEVIPLGKLKMAAPNLNNEFSHLTLAANNGAQFMVRDSSGKRTGYDAKTRAIFEEIPGSYYFVDAISDNETGTPASEFYAQAYLPGQSNQPYRVSVMAPQSGNVVLDSIPFGKSGKMLATQRSNLQTAAGSLVDVSVHSDGSFDPPEAPASKGYVEIDQTQTSYLQGTRISGLVWNRIWPTNPEVEMRLEASIDGAQVVLPRLERHLWGYDLPSAELGVHKLMIRVYLAGQVVDNVISYITVVPNGSREGATP